MGILDTIGRTAAEAANRAGNKAEEFIEVKKLQNEQSVFRSELASVKRKLGDYCYKMYQDGKLDDENMLKLCQEADTLNEKIEELDSRIADTRAGYRAKASDKDEERL